MFRAGVTLGVIYYYILLYIIHIHILLYIIFYLILYSSYSSDLLLFPSVLFLSFPFSSLPLLFSPFLPSLSRILLLPSPNHSSLFCSPSQSISLFPSSFKVYVSAFGYPYLYSSSIQSFQYPFPNNLTPHKLTEWMVEV